MNIFLQIMKRLAIFIENNFYSISARIYRSDISRQILVSNTRIQYQIFIFVHIK